MTEQEVNQVGAEVNNERGTLEYIRNPPERSHFLTQPLTNIQEANISEDSLKGSIETAFIADAEADSTAPADNRYAKRKPVYIIANIHKIHLNKGESTSRAIRLRNIIRNRGYVDGGFPDDCGHIVSCKLSGYMVDYNLFPQQIQLNRGQAGTYIYWRNFEVAIRLFLTSIPAKDKPRVEYTMGLKYGDKVLPDRPISVVYFARFYITEDKTDKNDAEKELLKFGREILNRVKQDTKENPCNFKVKVIEVIKGFNFSRDVENEFLDIVNDLEDVDKIIQPDHSYRRFRNDKGFAGIVDYIPVVGPVKGIVDGVEDLRDGYIVGGIGNIALGGVSLALDCSTLGAGSLLARGTAKVVGKAAAKSAGTAIAKSILVDTGSVAVGKALVSGQCTSARKKMFQ